MEAPTTHPTMLLASVFGLSESNGDGLGDFKGILEKSERPKEVVINFEDGSIKNLQNYLNGKVVSTINGSVSLKLELYGFKLLHILKG